MDVSCIEVLVALPERETASGLERLLFVHPERETASGMERDWWRRVQSVTTHESDAPLMKPPRPTPRIACGFALRMNNQ
jgi:hypothetical protein